MVETQDVTITSTRVVAKVCDICGLRAEYNDEDFDQGTIEFQEFVSIRFTGGYGSVFGDLDEIELDICQHCLKDKLGKYIRVNGEPLYE